VIPPDLMELPNWIVWRLVQRDGRPTKVPFDAKSGQPAKANDAATWCDLTTAERALLTRRYTGLGFVFAPGGGLFGVDLDGCLSSGGELAGWAEQIIEQAATYAEVSPSGSGIKVFGRGSFSGRGRRKEMPGEPIGGRAPGIEVYGQGRYFTVTGRHWPETPFELRNCQLVLAGLLATYWPPLAPAVPMRRRTGPATEPIERARRYLSRTPGAVSGQNGHGRTFRAACVLVREIGLSAADALALLSEWNQGCRPPWSEAELRHKIEDAQKVATAAG
jgi:hypothetical protein